jgi:Spy/CpxP family protein refolding chaperone
MSDVDPKQVAQRVWLPALALASMFAVGAACGVLADRTLIGPPHHRFELPLGGDVLLRDPFGELDLSAEQRKKIDALFEHHRSEVDAVVRDSEPKMRALSEKMDREMQAILTPEQRERLKAARERIEVLPAHHHRVFRPGPGPHGIFAPGPGGPPSASAPWQLPAPPP